MDLLETEAISVSDDECYYFNEYGTVQKICELLNELHEENQRLQHFESLYRERNLKLEKENEELKAKVDDKEIAVEVETEKLMQKVFNLINAKIKLYSHKPVSAPISQPMSVNFDADVDRLARLSELELLKKELQE